MNALLFNISSGDITATSIPSGSPTSTGAPSFRVFFEDDHFQENYRPPPAGGPSNAQAATGSNNWDVSVSFWMIVCAIIALLLLYPFWVIVRRRILYGNNDGEEYGEMGSGSGGGGSSGSGSNVLEGDEEVAGVGAGVGASSDRVEMSLLREFRRGGGGSRTAKPHQLLSNSINNSNASNDVDDTDDDDEFVVLNN